MKSLPLISNVKQYFKERTENKTYMDDVNFLLNNLWETQQTQVKQALKDQKSKKKKKQLKRYLRKGAALHTIETVEESTKSLIIPIRNQVIRVKDKFKENSAERKQLDKIFEHCCSGLQGIDKQFAGQTVKVSLIGKKRVKNFKKLLNESHSACRALLQLYKTTNNKELKRCFAPVLESIQKSAKRYPFFFLNVMAKLNTLPVAKEV